MNDDGPRLLIVEDDSTLRLLVCKQLELLSIPVEPAENGRIAIEKFSADNYSLILMDVMMPVVDGLVATRTIRGIESKKAGKQKTPIVGMTAYGDKQACLDAGMDDFLFKPVLLEQVSEILLKWLPAEVLGDRLRNSGQFSANTAKALTNRAQEELKETGAQLDKIQQQIDQLKTRFGL
jgi:CheY-like chemotaxis protein